MSINTSFIRREFIKKLGCGAMATSFPGLLSACSTKHYHENIEAVQSHTIEANGIRIHYLEQGVGPLVLLCHGFPESSYSWRHQLPALAAAGYRVVAPDMRGYGKTDQPKEKTAYTNLQLVNDMVGLLDALGESTCSIVGHDWGAIVAWNACLMYPNRFKAVAALSVPFSKRAPSAPLANIRKAFADRFFYVLYFQEQGIAEAELNADVPKSLRSIFFTISAEGDSKRRTLNPIGKAGKFLDTLIDPGMLPSWMSQKDFDIYVADFTRNGFDAPLNWYRNVDENWTLLAPYAEKNIEVPALFLSGDKDPINQFYKSSIDNLPKSVPGLTKIVFLPDCGHWTQQEKPNEVNALLIDFLKRSYV